MNEIDRLFQKYKNYQNFYEIFLLPELGGKCPRETLVATFLKQQELQEDITKIMHDIDNIAARQNVLINAFGEEIEKMKKRLDDLQRANMADKD